MDFFDPNSKFSQIMGTVFDYAKLGLLVLILSIPVITAMLRISTRSPSLA